MSKKVVKPVKGYKKGCFTATGAWRIDDIYASPQVMYELACGCGNIIFRIASNFKQRENKYCGWQCGLRKKKKK